MVEVLRYRDVANGQKGNNVVDVCLEGDILPVDPEELWRLDRAEDGVRADHAPGEQGNAAFRLHNSRLQKIANEGGQCARTVGFADKESWSEYKLQLALRRRKGRIGELVTEMCAESPLRKNGTCELLEGDVVERIARVGIDRSKIRSLINPLKKKVCKSSCGELLARGEGGKQK